MMAPRLDAAKHELHSLGLEKMIWRHLIAQHGVIGLQLYPWPCRDLSCKLRIGQPCHLRQSCEVARPTSQELRHHTRVDI